MKQVVIFRYLWNHEALAEAFQNLGYEIEINPSNKDLEKYKPDEILCCIANLHTEIKKPFTMLGLKQKLNAKHAPLIFWNRDGPSHMGDKWWRIWLVKHFKFLDIYATHTLQDAGHFADEVVYFPNAAWDSKYNLSGKTLQDLRDKNAYSYDVSFIGSITYEKRPENYHRMVFFKKLQQRLENTNIKFYIAECENNLSLAQQVEIIQKSKINLSCAAGCDFRYQGGYHGEPFSFGLPERCYGIANCGGFLLSDHRPHSYDDFCENYDFVSFKNISECVEKILYFCDDKNFDKLREIAENAYQTVNRKHLYKHRAEKLIEYVNYWKQKHKFLPVKMLYED